MPAFELSHQMSSLSQKYFVYECDRVGGRQLGGADGGIFVGNELPCNIQDRPVSQATGIQFPDDGRQVCRFGGGGFCWLIVSQFSHLREVTFSGLNLMVSGLMSRNMVFHFFFFQTVHAQACLPRTTLSQPYDFIPL